MPRTGPGPNAKGDVVSEETLQTMCCDRIDHQWEHFRPGGYSEIDEICRWKTEAFEERALYPRAPRVPEELRRRRGKRALSPDCLVTAWFLWKYGKQVRKETSRLRDEISKVLRVKKPDTFCLLAPNLSISHGSRRERPRTMCRGAKDSPQLETPVSIRA